MDMLALKRKLLDAGIFAGIMLTAALLVWKGKNVIGEANVSLVYLLAVMLISRFTKGRGWGIAASMLAALLQFLQIDPIHTAPQFWQTGLLVSICGMLVTAILISEVTARAKTEKDAAIAREQMTQTVFRFTRELLSTRGYDAIAAVSTGFFSRYFNCTVYMYVGDPMHGKVTVESPDSYERCLPVPASEQVAAAEAFRTNEITGNGTSIQPTAKATFFPIHSEKTVLGVVGIHAPWKGEYAEKIWSPVIVAMASIALALERQELSDKQRDILSAAEEERMRGNLLRAISHDLRTPLTGILGASEGILEAGEKADLALCLHFTRYIHMDAQWLLRMVENLLSITRIRGEAGSVQKNPEIVEEVVGEAVQRVKKRYPDAAINASTPEELLMVPMDAMLVEQVITNLVQNALTYAESDKPVQLQVYTRDNTAVFRVIDMGKGLGENPSAVFESLPRDKSGDSRRGMGIGLSICRSIVKAHGGHITAVNHSRGGALFVFNLPMEGDTCDDIQPADLDY